MEKEKTMVTTLRGVPEDLHWQIKEESLKRSRKGDPATVNDVYLELINKGLVGFIWSK